MRNQARFSYRGSIAGRPVAGVMKLNDPEVGLRVLFARLYRTTGIPIEKMEADARVVWRRELQTV